MGAGALTALGYEGPKWTIDEVVLLGAEERCEYEVLDRIRLG